MNEKLNNVEKMDSVEICISQKLKWSAKVKVYARNSDEAMRKALEKANFIEKKIKQRNK